MTTFNTGNYVRITSQRSGWNDPPLSLFSSLCFSRSLPSRRTPLFERLEQANRTEVPFQLFRNGSVNEFYRLKPLITLEQVISSVVEKRTILMRKTSKVRLTGRVL